MDFSMWMLVAHGKNNVNIGFPFITLIIVDSKLVRFDLPIDFVGLMQEIC